MEAAIDWPIRSAEKLPLLWAAAHIFLEENNTLNEWRLWQRACELLYNARMLRGSDPPPSVLEVSNAMAEIRENRSIRLLAYVAGHRNFKCHASADPEEACQCTEDFTLLSMYPPGESHVPAWALLLVCDLHSDRIPALITQQEVKKFD